MYIDFLSKILENIWCNIYNMIRICYSSQGPGRLLFPLYILTKEDLILRTLTNNFWLFDKNFLGMWKVTEKKNCCKFLLHFSEKCASDYMHFRWNSIGEKALALNSFEVNFMKIAYRRIFHFFFFYIKFVYGMWLCFLHEIHVKHNLLDRVWIWSISFIKMNCIN